jgi:NAD-dependent dihydropyrimidine dehydrogenase PreA subunit
VDVVEKSCVLECPVDCIYEGARTMYINPDECVDCGACKPACRIGAIYWEGDLPDDEQQHLADSAAFSARPCPAGMARSEHPVAPTPWVESASTRLWSQRCPQRTRDRRPVHSVRMPMSGFRQP